MAGAEADTVCPEAKQKIQGREVNMATEKCPCMSGKAYADCCKKIISGTAKAATPEELMRARYSAYAKAEVDFIVDSTHPEQRESNDREEIKKWAEKSEWLGLQIVKTEKGAPADEDGIVEFIANYTDHGVKLEHHEIAEFRKKGGEWFFYDGKMVPQAPFKRTAAKVGLNDPCPCNSGKKFKKCCGK